MAGGKRIQQPHAFCCHGEHDAAPVFGVLAPAHQALSLGAVGELNHAVLAQPKPLGEIIDGRGVALGNAGNLQQKLVLLGADVMLGGRTFAELQKRSQLITKVRERVQQRSRSLVG